MWKWLITINPITDENKVTLSIFNKFERNLILDTKPKIKFITKTIPRVNRKTFQLWLIKPKNIQRKFDTMIELKFINCW